MDDYIGKLVKTFESGSKGSLALGSSGNDWGLSCGSYQLTLRWGNCINFLKKYFPAESAELYFTSGKSDIAQATWPGEDYCSSPEEVQSVWTECYNKVGEDKFFEYEHEYIQDSYYEPIMKKLVGYYNPNNSCRAMQDCMWSWAVHRGSTGAYNEFKAAMDAEGISDPESINAADLLELCYDKRYVVSGTTRYSTAGGTSSERVVLRDYLTVAPLSYEGSNPTTEIVEESGVDIQKNITSINRNVNASRDIKYIVIHYTGNDGDTAYNNTVYFKSVNRSASAHYFVDENEIWQCVEDKDTAWHCGTTGTYYHASCRNANSLGVEMCSRKNGSTYYFKDQTVANAVELVKYLMDKYSVGIDNVIRHYDVTHKICPAPYCNSTANEKAWAAFKSKLTTASASTNTTTTSTSAGDNLYRVRKTWADASSQKGAYESLSNAKAMADKNAGYSVFDTSGKNVYTSAATTTTQTTTAASTQLGVDGKWGQDTTRRIQQVLGTTVDGIVSNQYATYKADNPGLLSSSWQWMSKPGSSGSQMVKALQKLVGATQDGYIGPNTIKAMQKYFETVQDGCVSNPSQLVKAIQTWLNSK